MGVGVEKQPTCVNAFMAGVVLAVGISWPLAGLLLWAWASWMRHAAVKAVLTSRKSMVDDECGMCVRRCNLCRRGQEQCRLQQLRLGSFYPAPTCVMCLH